MLLIRNLLYWLFLSVFTVVWMPIVVLSMLIPRGVNYTTTFWAVSLLWMLEYIIGLKYRVIGREHIPAEPSIICCKHQSGWETLAIQKFFPLQVFVAKKELFWIPFFGWGLKLAGTIGIDRGNPKSASQQIMAQGNKRKTQGLWISIFPEGTRIKPGFRGRYKHGAARMAQLLKMNLVPVALNSGEFWPKNSFFKYPGEITVVIGETINYQAAATPEELTKLCETWIENEQTKIQGAGPFAEKNPKIPTPLWTDRTAA
ncbi:lysophospholipid acyltransferase family protein [Stenoxybacter acetivorans]|uniref:lysophospholipid acyltransferase family protein n=1 Tax=Stenoxybacter acetivorans TaxID=422441 RepID=UPI000691541B|nr:lysophospholipid acyltransferase family protein [Stenoxybacter acetivorans]